MLDFSLNNNFEKITDRVVFWEMAFDRLFVQDNKYEAFSTSLTHGFHRAHSLGKLASKIMTVAKLDADRIAVKDSFDNSLYVARLDGKGTMEKIDIGPYGVSSFFEASQGILLHSHDYINRTIALYRLGLGVIWEKSVRATMSKLSASLLLLRSIHNYRNTGMEAREIESGNLVWSVEAENWPFPNFEISDILVSEDYAYITSTKAAAIAALDLSTGQLLQSWHTLPTGTTLGPQQSTVLPNPAHSVLHEEAGKILGLTGYYYWEIDLQTGALKVQDCTSGFKSRRLRAMTRPVCQGDHLYFSSDEVFEKPDGTLGHDIKLAAFNWRTRQIDWEWAFDHPGEGLYQIGMPKVHGDYLAAADTGGQLHLFKKTS